MTRIAIAVFDGVDELDVVGPFEVLRNATKAGAAIEVALASLSEELNFTGAHGLEMRADMRLDDTFDVLLVPGGGWSSGAAQGIRTQIDLGVLTRQIRDAHQRGATIASVCTGALAVGAAGIAKGRRMTTHHGGVEDLRAFGVQVEDERVVDDGDIVSGAGVTSGIDLALHLVNRYGTIAIAKQIAEEIEYMPHKIQNPAS
ncbi:MAG: DJ-1/PfpI family protein [Vulcanimicrobiaceae bacterium]